MTVAGSAAAQTAQGELHRNAATLNVGDDAFMMQYARAFYCNLPDDNNGIVIQARGWNNTTGANNNQYRFPMTQIFDDVWAVGNAGSLNALAIHWDGAIWNIIPTATLDSNDTNPVLVGIVALSSANVWTAGQFIVPIEGSAQHTLTENWNGSSWDLVPSANRQRSNNRLHGIAATPSATLWAVGTTGVFGKPERTFILRKDP